MADYKLLNRYKVITVSASSQNINAVSVHNQTSPCHNQSSPSLPPPGWLVLGVSRLRLGSVKPLYEGEAEAREVGVHRRYVEDSVSLFLLYFLQLAVMAPYLSQDLLKLVPLLTIVFAFGR